MLLYLVNIISNYTAVEIANFQESCCGLSFALLKSYIPSADPKMYFDQGRKPIDI